MKKAEDENSVVLFGDEVSFAMWGSLARTWPLVGEQPTVKTSGVRKGLEIIWHPSFSGLHFFMRIFYVGCILCTISRHGSLCDTNGA